MQLPHAAPGFDEPLEMLRACHMRILGQCDTLVRLAEHLSSDGVTDAARAAAQHVRHYFCTAAKHHHADEEQDLFPVLFTVAPGLAPAIHELKREHGEMERLWARLEPLLADLGSVTDTATFTHDAMHFRVVYHAHIERENGEILPTAQRALSVAQIGKLGTHMALRRGVKF